MGEEAFERYIKKNEHDFNQALEQHQKNGALRKQKRAKKRNKLQERHRVIVVDASSEEDIPISRREQIKQQEHSRQVVDSSSEDDVPLISVKNQGRKKQLETHNLARSNSDPPGRHSPVTRRAPLIQSTDDEEGVPSDDGSEVSLVGELVEKEKSKSRKRTTSLERINKEPNLGNSILSPKQTKFKATLPRQKPATDHTPSTAQGQVQSSGPPRKLSTPDCLTGSRTSDLHQGHGRSSGSVTQGSATILARKSKPAGPKTFTTTVAPFSTPHVERSTGSNLTRKPAETIILPTLGNNATYSRSVASIKMTNEPKTQRKSWNTDGQYKNLQSRRNAEKRSQTEGTPDLSALEFVGTRLPIFSNPRSTDPTDNPYGRRESGIRRVQEPDMNESSQQELADQAERLREKESKKIPLMCPYWRLSNNCPYPAEKCRFLHRDKDINGRDIEIGDIGGRVPPKYQTPPLTCIFWLQGPFGCRKSADICIFAHHNTGWLPQSTHSMDPVQIDSTALPISRDMVGHPNDARNSSPPREMRSVGSTCWYWAHGGCNKPEERCIYKHYDTGVIAQPPPDAQTVCRYFLNGTCRLTADMCKFSHVAPGRDLNRGTFLAMPTPQELTQQPMAERIQSRQRETAADFTVQNIIQPLVSDNSSTKEKQQQVSASTELQSAANAALSSILQPATVSSSSMKQSIEQTLKIAFNDLFEWGDDGVKRMMLDRKAFLLYHPVEHLEQLDVITRWLLMHHVEVCSLWFPGGWNYYRNQVAQGGSGIVIVSKWPLSVHSKTANTSRFIPILSTSRNSQLLVSYYKIKSAYGHLGSSHALSTIQLH
jgi:chromo domain-containing protein 1